MYPRRSLLCYHTSLRNRPPRLFSAPQVLAYLWARAEELPIPCHASFPLRRNSSGLLFLLPVSMWETAVLTISLRCFHYYFKQNFACINTITRHFTKFKISLQLSFKNSASYIACLHQNINMLMHTHVHSYTCPHNLLPILGSCISKGILKFAPFLLLAC